MKKIDDGLYGEETKDGEYCVVFTPYVAKDMEEAILRKKEGVATKKPCFFNDFRRLVVEKSNKEGD